MKLLPHRTAPPQDERQKTPAPYGPRRRAPAEEYCYVVHAVGTGYCKIGQTRNFPQRLKDLATASPHTLAPLMLVRDPRYKQLEAQLHSLFRAYRGSGEWFDLGENLVSWLAGAMSGTGPGGVPDDHYWDYMSKAADVILMADNIDMLLRLLDALSDHYRGGRMWG